MKSAKRAARGETSQATPPASASKPAADREKLRMRAMGLVARAAHESTPQEEARTSALVAAKLIHGEKLLESAPGRHALLERLEALDDDALNDLAMVVEEALETGGVTRTASQASRWRNEAKHLQRKLDMFARALRWILQGYKIGLAERPGQCGLCRRALLLGDIVVWKRRRAESAHYACCVALLQQHGAIS